MDIEITVQVSDGLALDAIINGLETTRWCGVKDYDFHKVEEWWLANKHGVNQSPDMVPFDVFNAYEEDEPLQLTKKKVRRGLHLMAQEHPKHFADLLREDYDAVTSDVLLQLSLFGELVYG